MNSQDVKTILEDNFQFLQNMSVPEYTLYRKWIELNQKYKEPLTENSFEISIKNNIWQPNEIDDYLNIEPEVVHVIDKKDLNIWNVLRYFIHRMPWKANPGRLLRFYVKDKITEKYLGIFSLGSDFISVGGRDDYIGWSMDNRLKDKMLKHTAMGSTIAATQPLGYNYLGGKFISLMVCSDIVTNAWYEKYNDILAGISTTSLYGGYSQYNRLNYWRKCKSSEGKVKLEPSDDAYIVARNWYKETYPEIYNEAIKKSHPKNRILSLIYKELKIKVPENNAPRGVYFCKLYTNTNEFLSKKDDVLKDKLFDNRVKVLSDLWKERYAKNRISNLKEKNDLQRGLLFYNDIIGMSWEETKEKYLND